MKRIFKIVIPVLIFSAFFFLVGFLKNYHLPRLKTWTLIEIEKNSDKYLPVRIWPKGLEISFFPLELNFKDIKVTPKSELKSQLASFNIKEVKTSLNLLALLTGELRVSNIELDTAVVNAIVESNRFNKSQPQKVNSKLIFLF